MYQKWSIKWGKAVTGLAKKHVWQKEAGETVGKKVQLVAIRIRIPKRETSLSRMKNTLLKKTGLTSPGTEVDWRYISKGLFRMN